MSMFLTYLVYAICVTLLPAVLDSTLHRGLAYCMQSADGAACAALCTAPLYEEMRQSGCLLAHVSTAAAIVSHAVLIAALFYASLVDIRTRVVPTVSPAAAMSAWLLTTLVCAVIGVCPYSYAFGQVESPSWILAGMAGGAITAGVALVCAMLLERRSGVTALGGGDIKLFFIVGLYLGPEGGMVALGLSCVLALLWQAVMLAFETLRRFRERRRGVPPCCTTLSNELSIRRIRALPAQTLPFVPFIASAVIVIIAYGVI